MRSAIVWLSGRSNLEIKAFLLKQTITRCLTFTQCSIKQVAFYVARFNEALYCRPHGADSDSFLKIYFSGKKCTLKRFTVVLFTLWLHTTHQNEANFNVLLNFVCIQHCCSDPSGRWCSAPFAACTTWLAVASF